MGQQVGNSAQPLETDGEESIGRTCDLNEHDRPGAVIEDERPGSARTHLSGTWSRCLANRAYVGSQSSGVPNRDGSGAGATSRSVADGGAAAASPPPRLTGDWCARPRSGSWNEAVSEKISASSRAAASPSPSRGGLACVARTERTENEPPSRIVSTSKTIGARASPARRNAHENE